MARLQQLTSVGYTVEVVWGCQYDRDILPHHPERKQHPIVQSSSLNTRDAFYAGGTESIVLHYKIGDGEMIQYYNVMSRYPFICKYFKFSLGHQKIHVADACRDKQVMLSIEGLTKCTALHPRRPYHPVLRFRCNMILFCLCKTCALECYLSGNERTRRSRTERCVARGS
jgi:hypothetical protein